MARVLALVDDLFFQAKMLETARQVGVALQFCTSSDDFLAQAVSKDGASGPSAPALLILDLNARADGIEALERLQAAGNQRPAIAFLSHVQVELAERARAAGCRQVLPRSKFTQHLAEILSQAKASA